MPKKIIFDDELKNQILKFVDETYQCNCSDLYAKFGVSRTYLIKNMGKDFVDSLFHGCKDATKQKLREANLGKKLSEETKLKISRGAHNALSGRDPAVIKEVYDRVQATKASKFGSIEKYYEYQAEKSKQTKLERYGDSNYNNMDKNHQTKLERYGDQNYNNKDKIRSTQYSLYGCFAFNDKEKYESTMLERYGVKHNWSSEDPMLNGRYTMYKNAGSKEQHYKNILEKGRHTRKELYGDEFYSNSEKAQQTMLEKYGVRWYCISPQCRELCNSPESMRKKLETQRSNGTLHHSEPEQNFYQFLVEKFGADDIIREYQDPRYCSTSGYMFKCDFYIKSKDVFIELNLFPTHYTHPFNPSSEEDLKTLELINSNPTTWNKTTADVWTVRDPEKLNCAIKNNLNYFYFYPGDNYYDVIQTI